MTNLEQVDRAQGGRSRRTLLIIIGVVVLLVAAAGGAAWLASSGRADSAATAAAPSPSPVQTTAAAATAAPSASQGPVVRYDDPDGYAACADAQAWAGSTDYDLERMRAIGQRAALSRHGMIHASGQLLVAEAKLADRAKGTDKELETSLKVIELATDLYSTCKLYKYL